VRVEEASRPGKYPKENIQVSEHGENLKSCIVFFLCYCLLFIIRLTLPQIILITSLTPGIKMICIYLMHPSLCIREEFSTLVLNFLMLSLRQLRKLLATPENLK
jgi:hypothetical protein